MACIPASPPLLSNATQDVGDDLSNGLAMTPDEPPPLPEKHHSYGDIMLGAGIGLGDVISRRASSVSQSGNRAKVSIFSKIFNKGKQEEF